MPVANGNPTPTYAVEGSLPAGIAFDTGTRVISGTPSATGSGTITIRATNSEGMADWTVTYTTAAALAAPSFTDPTGDAQTWTVGDAITVLTVPAASGNPSPTYAAVGSGTITIRHATAAGSNQRGTNSPTGPLHIPRRQPNLRQSRSKRLAPTSTP